MRLPPHATDVGSPASAHLLSAIAQEVGPLPRVLTHILLTCNGFRVNNWLFFSAEDLVERNVTYEVQLDAPEWVAIANDGGGSFILCRGNDPAAYIADMASVDARQLLSDDALDWIERGCPKAEPKVRLDLTEIVDVVLKGAQAPLAVVAELRRAFESRMPAHEALSRVRSGHEFVLGTMHRAKAERVILSLSDAARQHIGTRPSSL